MFSRRKIAALVAEFLGTAVLSFVVLTVSRSNIGLAYFVAIAAGLAVMLLGLALGRDVHLNPAYTLALWTGRRVRTLKAIAFIIVQVLGAMAAYALYKYFSGGHVQALPTDYESKVLVAEAVGAFVFAFAAVGAQYRGEHRIVRNVIAGGAYTLGALVASVAAAGFINPAVALASNALAWSTYVLGPVLGAVIGVNLYGLLFAAEPTFSRKKAVARTVVEERVKEDSEAVKPARLEKIEAATEEAKAEKAEKSSDKKTSGKKKNKKK